MIEPWKSNVAPGGSDFTSDLYTNQIRDAENTTARVEAKFSARKNSLIELNRALPEIIFAGPVKRKLIYYWWFFSKSSFQPALDLHKVRSFYILKIFLVIQSHFEYSIIQIITDVQM